MLGWCSAEQVDSDLVAEGSVWWLASPQLLQLPGMLTALSPLVLDCSPILSSFQVILLEHIIMCRLVTGHKATALQEISQVCQLCQQSPRLFSNHAAQLHTLLVSPQGCPPQPHSNEQPCDRHPGQNPERSQWAAF